MLQTFNPATPAFGLAPQTTPGSYIRQCRKRAGLSVAQCSRAIALGSRDRLRASDDLAKLEADRPGDYGQLVRQLKDRGVFPFDFGTFTQLAAATCAPELDDVADV